MLFLLLLLNLVTSFKVNAYFAVFDEAYNSTMKVSSLIPWKMFDRLIISFANLDEYGNLTNLNLDDIPRIKNVVSLYKKARPNGELFVSLYDEGSEKMLYASQHSEIFSESVRKYLRKFKLNGLDLDWETIGINSYFNELTNLSKAVRGKLTHAIWPGVHDNNTVGRLANIVDQINIMSYEMSIPALENLIKQYNSSGFPYQKMILGMETESQKENKNTILGKLELVKKYNLAGIYVWRLDNDDIVSGVPSFKTTKMLYDALRF